MSQQEEGRARSETAVLPAFRGDPDDLAARIEHTLLRPESTSQDVDAAAQQARAWRVRALVVKPCYVGAAAALLRGTEIRPVTVIGFPHGGQTPEVKAYEARDAVARGAAEVDMVINVGALRAGRADLVSDEMRAVAEAAAGHPLKVIIETAYLTDAEKALAAELAARAGAAYVKTSTGFAPTGAAVADIVLIRRVVGRALGIKASGGIRTYAEARALLEAGADLLGVSQTAAILAGAAGDGPTARVRG